MDSAILTFLMHANATKDSPDRFDRHFHLQCKHHYIISIEKKALLELAFRGKGNATHCICGSTYHRTTEYPLKCLYLSILFNKTIIRQINMLIRLSEVNRSQKSGTSTIFTLSPTCQIMDSSVLPMPIIMYFITKFLHSSHRQ